MNLFRNPCAASAFEPEAFFGREEQLSMLLRAFGRGGGTSVLLTGPPGAGKTSLLLKLASTLAQARSGGYPRPFPFYFAFSTLWSTPAALAGRFLLEFIGQLLAFASPGAVPAVSASEACDRLSVLGFPACGEALSAHLRAVESGDALAALANAFSAPFAQPEAPVYPVILLDDFRYASRIDGVPEGALLSVLRPFVKSGRHPIVLSGAAPGKVSKGLLSEGLYGAFRRVEAGALSPAAAACAWDYHCSCRSLSTPDEVRHRIVGRLGGIPAYLKMFADEMSIADAPLRDVPAFETLYARSVTQGSLNGYWKDLFEGMMPDRRMRTRAIRFLKRVLCDGFPPDSVEEAFALYGGPSREAAAVLSSLEFEGFARIDLDRVEFHRDPVLEDFLAWGVERGVMGCGIEAVAAGIVQARLSSEAPPPNDSGRETVPDAARPDPKADPSADPPAPGAVEFGLSLPKRADTEIVAGRLAEAVATRGALDAVSVDRIRMAIIEACLDAFEGLDGENGSVRLRYCLSPGRIEIFVGSEGGSSRRNGRGISLVRELVDEVEELSGKGGSGIRMVKYVGASTDSISRAVDAG